MNITLKQLRVFIAVTQQDTLSEAADILCLSKAAVSLSLAELEKQVGHTLFDRVNNRLILNQEGKLLLPLADELVSRAGDIEELFSSGQTLKGTLRIGASNTIGNQVAPFLLSRFRKEYVHKDQTLIIGNSEQIAQKLMDFELDIGLVEGEVSSPHLNCTPWFSDQMVIIASPSHPLSSREEVQTSELEHSHWLLREPGSGTREYFLKHLAADLKSWSESFELSTTEAIINSASAGLGIACLSKLSVRSAVQDGRVTILNIPLTEKRDYWMVIRKDKYQSPLAQEFIHFCKQYRL